MSLLLASGLLGFSTLARLKALDVVVSQMIIDGKTSLIPTTPKIQVKSRSPILGFNSRGLSFADGTEVPVGVVVFATGYGSNMKLAVSKWLDSEVPEKLEQCWLLDEEDNLRGF
ncbi:flavin-containing monooxygenase [Fusarium acutatum]|uniref:Flavin-containing monooxygenase n=1 Tax=Fusarium acutatum TaxID=78861 RepID=A0A8H4NFI9_9HYPO|nr:flavin-containing monooxygenase [Fusarium acutatum]